ncbi:hypothetical protein N1027_06135 [Herbiconiux sp. CPCC 205763]|uniref:Uncharacterized protein n=1 Tax=Herbiconiux aconitum TaxID=2970913 RepID=A0ABT2GNI7_9MICO|nr:hypothetical protein [Herbiconiux aconitum]MCS5717711.1 hypothetical protein [Herbiconiux aconitum]
MIKTELVALATDASYANINLSTMPFNDLRQLRDTMAEIGTRLDDDEDLAIRFSWLIPLIDAELEHRARTGSANS